MPPSPIPPNITISPTSWTSEPSIHLRQAQRAEILATYNRLPGPEPTAAEIPIFLVLKLNNIPAACGGLKPLGRDVAEVKRMFVLFEYRGKQRLATLVLRELETRALLQGWRTLKLGTGSGMLAARRFYEREGFEQVGLWGRYVDAPDSVCYEKVLG